MGAHDERKIGLAVRKNLMRCIGDHPVIAAIRKEEDAVLALRSPVRMVFLLHADIFNLSALTTQFRDAGKAVFVHVDMLEGVGRDATAVRWLAEMIRPTGILTTRNQHAKAAREHGLFVIQRFFMIDHQSFDMAVRTVHSIRPDMAELMPALMPSVIARFKEKVEVPVIAGGLLSTKEEMLDAINAGAMGVSTGNPLLWG